MTDRRHAAQREKEGGDPPVEALFRPLDPRRIREIRKWLEGTRPDAPTREELAEFETWVAQEIEWHLARHQPVRDLLALLNAAREQAVRMDAVADRPGD